jgi:hypothetical protein
VCGELADEVREVAVVRVTARGPAQHRDALAGNALPVAVERLDSRIEEHEPSTLVMCSLSGCETKRQGWL